MSSSFNESEGSSLGSGVVLGLGCSGSEWGLRKEAKQ